MGKLIRLNEFTAIEFESRNSEDLNTKKLYRYDFAGQANKSQLINDDLTNNSRVRSFSPYLNNTLLKPTPEPFYKNHETKELSVLLGDASLPSVEYHKCKVHFVNGFAYNSKVVGTGVRIYVTVNGDKEITLASILDLYNDTKVAPNTKEIFFEGYVFSTSYSVDILNVHSLKESTSQELQPIKALLLGSGNISLSDYKIEYFTIDGEGIKTFIGSDNFEYTYVTQDSVFTNYYKYTIEDEELVNFVRFEQPIGCLSLGMVHSRFGDVKSYLQNMSGYDDFVLTHELTLNYIKDSDSVASDAITLRNTFDSFINVLYKPVKPAVIFDAVQVELRSYANSASSGLIIERFFSKVFTDMSMFSDAVLELTVNKLNVANKVTINETTLMTPNMIPKVVEVTKTVYAKFIEAETIKLLPYDIAVIFSDPSYLNISSISMKIEERTYYSTKSADNSFVFNISAIEFYRKAKEYYLFDSEGSLVGTGKLVRE